MRDSDLILCITDPDGKVTASNEQHSRMHLRPFAGLIDHNFREWTPHDQLFVAEQNYARTLSGEPRHFVRKIMRSDGTIAASRAQLFPTCGADGKLLVVATLQIIAPEKVILPDAFNIAEYASNMAVELSKMMAGVGLGSLSKKFHGLAAEAATVAEMLTPVFDGGKKH